MTIEARLLILSSVMLSVPLSLGGCAFTALGVAGQRVEVRQEMNQDGCENLGPVFGKSGGSFGGSFINVKQWSEYATNDLRNKAAAKGANVVVYSTRKLVGLTPTATMGGIAYRCP